MKYLFLSLSLLLSLSGVAQTDVALIDIISPKAICNTKKDTLKITVQNQGSTFIDSLHIHWQINQLIDSAWFHVNLLSDSGAQIDLGIIDTASQPAIINIVVDLANDAVPFNNFLTVNLPYQPAPIADFNWEGSYHTAAFNNLTSDIDSAFWNFGDGASSNFIHPVHLYGWTSNDSMCFSIKMQAYNSCGMDSITKILYLLNSEIISPLNFDYTKQGYQVSFYRPWQNSIHSSYWDFGDGTTSTLPNPTHTYIPVGPFDCHEVMLAMETSCGIDTMYRNVGVGNYPSADPCNTNYITTTHKTQSKEQPQVQYLRTQKKLIIKNADSYIGDSFVLYTMAGKQLGRWQVNQTEKHIHLTQLPTGIYLYRMDNFTGKLTVY